MNKDNSVGSDKVVNPFDFANPVSSKKLFVGRERERKDIEYYLDYARDADRTINLALLGERAAGKTSLLNIIEMEALDRGLVPVRIDLNESDVETHLAFWFKIIDAIINKVVEQPNPDGTSNLFGGLEGKTFDTYLDLISTYEVPESKIYCPFLFPIQFAKAMGAQNPTARVSDQIVKRDLKLISIEVGRPIVLLIDECNILSAHRPLLEMVRNTFMNLPGFMLVFTGTPDLFPLMDEVFSPIVRQFKRIEVAPFADICETRTAILEPLKSVNQAELFPMPPAEILDSPNNMFFHGDLRDVHDLTGGRPYEIQLVCHFMFRRVQQGHDTYMCLSFDMLEDVLRELRQSHDVDSRPVISEVKALDTDGLRRLRLLLQSGGKLPVEHLIFCTITTMVSDDKPSELMEAFDQFVELGILSKVNGCASFRGDDFDRIVCKYAARQRKINLSFEHWQFEEYFDEQISRSVLVKSKLADQSAVIRRPTMVRFFSSRQDSDDETRDLGRLWPKIGVGYTVLDVCRELPTFASKFHHFVDEEETLVSGFALIRVHASTPGAEYTAFFGHAGNDVNETNVGLENSLTTLEQMKKRAESIGGSFEFETRELSGATVDELVEFAANCGDDKVLRRCTEVNQSRMYRSYVRGSDKSLALTYAIWAARGAHLVEDDDANNIGYVLLSCDRLEDADRVLQIVAERSTQHSLAKYNLGLVRLRQHRLESARDLFNEVLRIEDASPHERIGVLLVPQYLDGQLNIEEEWTSEMREETDREDIRLADAANSAMAILQKMELK